MLRELLAYEAYEREVNAKGQSFPQQWYQVFMYTAAVQPCIVYAFNESYVTIASPVSNCVWERERDNGFIVYVSSVEAVRAAQLEAKRRYPQFYRST